MIWTPRTSADYSLLHQRARNWMLPGGRIVDGYPWGEPPNAANMHPTPAQIEAAKRARQIERDSPTSRRAK